jgi:hypothetical protein
MPSRKASWLSLHPRNKPECQQIRHRVWSAVSVRLEVNVVDMENRLAKSHLVLTGVVVEKLILGESAENSSRQDALQAIFSARLDIFYHRI